MQDTVKILMIADTGAIVNFLKWKDTKNMGINPESLPILKIKLSSVTGQVFKTDLGNVREHQKYENL